MISITVQSSEGTVLAYAEHPEEAWLSVDRAYLPGDVFYPSISTSQIHSGFGSAMIPSFTASFAATS